MYTKSTIFTSFVYTERCFKRISKFIKINTEKYFITNRSSPICVSKIRKLEAQYLGNNTFWNDKSKQILTEKKDIDTRKITQFIRSMCDHLYARFPSDELKCWSAFDPTALKNCTFDFGVAEAKKLCMQYKDLISVTNDNLIIKQYNNFKFLMSKKLISGTIT